MSLKKEDKMVSNNLEDYEVLSILGADLNSTCYKVKHKNTSEIFVWKAVGYENFTESEKQSLLSQIDKQKLFEHPHLLQVYDYILHEETKILYLVSEFCANGNLNGIIQKCIIENEYLSEDFLWRTLYQIACALKIRGNLTTNLSLNNIFIDLDYKVKLFNDGMFNQEDKISPNVHFGTIMFELCTLQAQKKDKKNSVAIIKQILTEIPNYYSNELKEIIKFTMTANFDTKMMVDAILCHPTILLKLSQSKINNIYIKNLIMKNKQNETRILENFSNSEIETTYRLRLENLKNRETALKIREEKHSEKAHELHKREKKIALTERMVREKMLQAELYLKRCREVRSTSSGSNKSSSSSNRVTSYEKIDSSFSADCGDSSFIVPTSNKLILQGVKKPTNFIRMMSERRVRFKGHSPLKDMCMRNNFKEPRTVPQQYFNPIKETNSTTSSDKSVVEENFTQPGINLEDKSNKVQKKNKSRKKLDLFSVLPVRSRKPLVDLNVQLQNNVIHEETENGNVQYECRPISWTEESKQHAFDLLRIMNQGEENEFIKHTYL